VLGGLVITGYRGFCSSRLVRFVRQPRDVTDAFKYQEGQTLRRTCGRAASCSATSTWEEYRGSVTIPTASAAARRRSCRPTRPGSCRSRARDLHHPVRAGGLRGDRQHARPAALREAGADPSGLNKFRLLNTQSNPICLCLRPDAVIKLTKS
jgi:hypothetical protein